MFSLEYLQLPENQKEGIEGAALRKKDKLSLVILICFLFLW